jgi:hypothetical protein
MKKEGILEFSSINLYAKEYIKTSTHPLEYTSFKSVSDLPYAHNIPYYN